LVHDYYYDAGSENMSNVRLTLTRVILPIDTAEVAKNNNFLS